MSSKTILLLHQQSDAEYIQDLVTRLDAGRLLEEHQQRTILQIAREQNAQLAMLQEEYKHLFNIYKDIKTVMDKDAPAELSCSED